MGRLCLMGNRYQKQFFNRLFPLSEWKQKYKHAEVDPVKFSVHFDKEFLKENKRL